MANMATISYSSIPHSTHSELKSDYMDMVDSADYYMSRSRWLDAEKFITAALRMEPANPANHLLWSNLGIVRRNRHDLKGSIEAFDIGLARAPRSTVLLSNRAYTHIEAGNDSEALLDLSTALDVDSLLELPRLARATILLNSGITGKAISDFSFLIRHNPKNPEALAGLAQCHAAEGNLPLASEVMAKACAIAPDEDFLFLSILYDIESGSTLKAADTLREALTLFPRSGKIYALRAKLHQMNYQHSEADAALKMAREFGADPHLIQQLGF